VQISYISIAKFVVSEMDVSPIDLCVIRTGTLCLCAYLVSRYNGCRPISDIRSEQWGLVVTRALFGAAAYGSMVLAVGNVSILVFTILLNTAPFWTALLGYYAIGEVLS